jgi:arabinogalactan oligomer/maltooligosaccharide transport system substrate-binding protein
MKKILTLVLAFALALTMCGAAFAEGYSGDLKVWVADAALDFTIAQIDAFKAANPEYANMNVTVEAVGEGDAASKVITDVAAAADIFGFAQDQLARMVAAGAVEVVEPGNAETVKAENDAGAVSAVTMGDEMYAYPMTSDNGYFLYYDKSVVTDPSTMEQILADCEAAGKSFYMELNSGWYQTAFFFGAGCTLTYDSDNEGNLTKCNVDYASENGLKAFKSLIKVAASPAFVNGSSISNATNVGAIVDGTWDSEAAKELFGDNYAAAKLPTVDGYQMSGFGGFKMLGVKPQTEEDKLAACDALAAWLCSGDVQLARYEALGWGPSNLAAQQSDAVKNDAALSALADQLQYTIPQGQYPGDYWSLATGLGDRVIADEFDNADDDALMAALTEFQDACISYAG